MKRNIFIKSCFTFSNCHPSIHYVIFHNASQVFTMLYFITSFMKQSQIKTLEQTKHPQSFRVRNNLPYIKGHVTLKLFSLETGWTVYSNWILEVLIIITEAELSMAEFRKVQMTLFRFSKRNIFKRRHWKTF